MLKNSFLRVYFTSKGLNDLKNNILVAIELGWEPRINVQIKTYAFSHEWQLKAYTVNRISTVPK